MNDSKFLPVDLRTVALTVDDSERYGLHDDSDWDSLVPKGHGFIRLPTTQAPIDLPGELSSPNAYFAVSMYHQLHCLNGFRHLTLASMAGNQTQHNVDHAVHCLSYLRQLLLCHADVALEPARLADTVNGGQTQAVYGEGTTHRCKDWTQIREWVEGNYQDWKEEDIHEVSEGTPQGNKSHHHHGSDHGHQKEGSGHGHSHKHEHGQA